MENGPILKRTWATVTIRQDSSLMSTRSITGEGKVKKGGPQVPGKGPGGKTMCRGRRKKDNEKKTEVLS